MIIAREDGKGENEMTEGIEAWEYETGAGTLRVIVHGSEIRQHHEIGVGWVPDEFPVLIVTSKPDRMYDSRGWLRYRGRDYLIETGYRYESGSWWNASETYTQGAKRRVGETGLTDVSYGSGPSKWLYEMVTEARDAFVTAHPEWIIDSMIMRRRQLHERAEHERDQAVKDAETQAATMGRLDREIEALCEQRGA